MTDDGRSAFHRLLPRRIRRSYAATFAFVLVGVTFCIVLVGGVTYVHAGDVLERDTQQQVVTNAEIQANQLDEWVRRMRVTLRSTAESAAFQSGDRGEIAVYLWEVVERDDDVAAAYYVDTTNHTVLSNAGSAEVSSAVSVTTGRGREAFVAAARESSGASDVVVSDPFRPTPDGAPVVLFATTVPSTDGSRAVVAVVDLVEASDRHLHHTDDGTFVVRNDAGTVVMSQDESRILTADELATETLTGARGHAATTLDGRPTEVGYAALDARPWTVTSRVPAATAYALRGDILAGLGSILAAVLVGAGLIAVTLGRDTTRSVRTLAERARRLTAGELDDPVRTDREDEFGHLFSAFEAMRQSLRARIREAETAREEAEDARREALEAKAESEAFSRHLERTAAAYGDVMASCASGDLASRLDPDDRSEAMRTVAVSFNAMMDDVQERNEQLATISHVLSHDLRNPLNVATGRANLLAEDVDSPHVGPLCDALDRIDTIIDDAVVLALHSNVEETTPVDLRARATSAWALVETETATLTVTETTTFDADRDLLSHVFENLFRNAVEHGATSDRTAAGDDAPPDAGVDVRVGPLADGRGFYVEDDGDGIPAADRDAVLEAGYTTNRENGGTGFGLSIVKTVADAHGWTVTVTESEAGGARFEVGVEPQSERECVTADAPTEV
jgi:methyl-accepting chemotaxis protein